MDPDVDIKQVTGFKTPNQYGCIKLRHGNSYKLSKMIFLMAQFDFHEHAFPCLTE